MAAKLRGQLEPLFQFLTSKSVGDVVSRRDIEEVTGWTGTTFPTHVSKHKFDGFLAKVGDEQYRILRDGSSISKGELASAMSQVSPERLVLTRGIRVTGEHDEYTLRKPLGNGAVGHVWEAEPALGGPRVAVKVMIPREDLLEPKRLDNVRARFRRETKNGLRLDHPRLVKYRDHGELSAHPFLVMDAADESLAQIIARKPLTDPESLVVVVACLEGLAHLHEQGCVHRDIKPHNILAKGREYLLGDLGIVRWSDMNPAFTSAATLTTSSIQLGSWHYMAPEQRLDPHDATAPSDLYALGISWYEMITGKTLDPAMVGAQQFPPGSTDSRINETIAAMLAFRPADRPTVAALLLQVRHWSDSRS